MAHETHNVEPNIGERSKYTRWVSTRTSLIIRQYYANIARLVSMPNPFHKSGMTGTRFRLDVQI